MRARHLLPAVLVIVCTMLGGLWPAGGRPVTSTDGPQFLEWCQQTHQC